MRRRETYMLVFGYLRREQVVRMVTNHSTYNEALKKIDELKGRLTECEKYLNSRIIKETSEVVYEDGND